MIDGNLEEMVVSIRRARRTVADGRQAEGEVQDVWSNRGGDKAAPR